MEEQTREGAVPDDGSGYAAERRVLCRYLLGAARYPGQGVPACLRTKSNPL